MPIELDPIAGPKGGAESTRLARFWLDQINSVKDNAQMKHWLRRGESIIRRYRDERNRTDEEGQRRYNALWSNVEILTPALYGKTPLPVTERRFRDKDPVGRGAAQILERALRNEIEICGYHDALTAAVRDYLLPGRGVVWVRYEPEIEEGISLPVEAQTDMRDDRGELPGRQTPPTDQPKTITEKSGRVRPRLINQEPEEPEEEADESGQETEPSDQQKGAEIEKLESTGDRIIRESTPVDFVEWSDFFTFPVRARNWNEVTAVAKLVYMSRDQMKRRFGKAIGGKIPLEKDTRGDRTQNTMLQAADEDKGKVYEIWNKSDEKLYWVAMGYDYLCDRKEDPLTLENFFPVPRPLFANPTNNTLIPVPDFIQYQDQAIQIDELTQRIAMLTKACKMAGLYNAAAKDIQRLFNESVENELIPVDDWAAFAEQGGVEGNWSLMPVQVIKDVINELMMVKQKQIEEMDRLTGINDIMRGTSDARETLGGVRLKSNNTGTRLTHRQNEVARFARDTVRIMADIMSQHFSPQSLIEVSGALYEEGLGPEDMPPLSQLLPSGAPPTNPANPTNPASAPPSGPVAQGQPGQAAPGGGPLLPPPSGVPQPGSNVVPFKPQLPGAPPPGSPPQAGMPPGGPQMPMGAGMPPLPPELQQKLEALQRIAKAIALLRNERLRGFRVDIEVDSTIFADAAQEKQDRTEFLAGVTQFLTSALEMSAAMPPIVPLLGKLLTFGVRGYRVGRDMESAIEEFTEQAGAYAQHMASQPNPAQQKLQLEGKKVDAQVAGLQQKAQSEQKAADAEVQRQQIENQGEQSNAAMELQQKQVDLQMRQMEMQIQEIKAAVEMFKAKHEIGMSQMEAQHGAQQMHQQAQHEANKMQMESQRMHQEAEHETGMMEQKAEHEANMMKKREAEPLAKPSSGTQ
jgi:hypothetical protein